MSKIVLTVNVNRQLRHYLVVAVCVTCFVLVHSNRAQESSSGGPEVGSLVGDIKGADVDGLEFSLSDYRGKVVLLFFWGDWCPPSRSLYSHLNELTEKHKDHPFAIVGVNTHDNVDRLKELAAEETISWRCFVMSGDDSHKIADWKIYAYPTLYLIDQAGVIQQHIRGASPAKLIKLTDELVSEAAQMGEEEIEAMKDAAKNKE